MDSETSRFSVRSMSQAAFQSVKSRLAMSCPTDRYRIAVYSLEPRLQRTMAALVVGAPGWIGTPLAMPWMAILSTSVSKNCFRLELVVALLVQEVGAEVLQWAFGDDWPLLLSGRLSAACRLNRGSDCWLIGEQIEHHFCERCLRAAGIGQGVSHPDCALRRARRVYLGAAPFRWSLSQEPEPGLSPDESSGQEARPQRAQSRRAFPKHRGEDLCSHQER